MKKKNILLVLCVLFTAFIFCRSMKDAGESSAESSFFVNLILPLMRRICNLPHEGLAEYCTVIVRKTAHVCEFAVQSVLLCGYFSCFDGKIKNNISWILFVGLFTACIDEAIQLTAEGRAGLISDVFIDFAGTACGILLSLVVQNIIKKLNNIKKSE